MGDFVPKFKPGQSWTAVTSADVTGGQLLEVSGENTVGPAAADSVASVGVAAFNAKSGSTVTVYSPKIAILNASGAIAAKALVSCAAAGAVKALAAVSTPTAADVTNTRGVVGVAMSAAAGNKVKVYFLR